MDKQVYNTARERVRGKKKMLAVSLLFQRNGGVYHQRDIDKVVDRDRGTLVVELVFEPLGSSEDLKEGLPVKGILSRLFIPTSCFKESVQLFPHSLD